MSKTSISMEGRLSGFSKDKSQLLQLILEQKSRARQEIKAEPRAFDAGVAQLPTSWAQQRLWFISQVESRTEVYHVTLSVRLHGPLDETALRRALDALVMRHESLRTSFGVVDGAPVQCIRASGAFSLLGIDLEHCSDAVREEQLQLHKTAEARDNFDLNAGPLVRGRLLRIRADEHVLLIAMHHIISDGWSLEVLMREISLLYRSQGQTAQLPPLRVQYADYALWQRQWLHQEARASQLNYWKNRLAGAPAQLELPTDRPRPEVQSFRGSTVDLVLDRELSAALRATAQRHDVTLFMLLYAAWTILLMRLSRTPDVVIGTPVANRQHPELEPLIGFFVNTLALRVQAEGRLPFGAFLQRVKETTLQAYQHQDVPFEHVVETLQPERSLSRNPIFQVMFALQTAPKGHLDLPQVRAVEEPELYESSMFDLMLSMDAHGEQLRATLNYASDLFDQQTVERWLENFRTLLLALPASTHVAIGDLPLLSGKERRQLLDTFNDTRVDSTAMGLVHDLFEAQVARTPFAPALEHEGRVLTYRELNDLADRLAVHLMERGVQADQPVGVCLPRQPELIIALLAILKAGGAYLPLDPNYPPQRLQQMLDDARPSLLLAQADVQARLPATDAKLIPIDATIRELTRDTRLRAEVGAAQVTPNNLIYVIYTSGSTGKPKATAMPHRAMTNLIAWHHRNFKQCTGQRVLQFAALSFDVAFQEIFTTLCTGGTLVLIDEWTRRDAGALVDYLVQHHINRLFIPPVMLQGVAEQCHSSGSSMPNLQDVICAGEQLRITPEIVELFAGARGRRLHNHYGPTETHVVTALTLHQNPNEWPQFPSIGKPIDNAQIYILDERGQPVPMGVAGEIYVGGDVLACGYLGRPDLTAERFVRSPFHDVENARLYRTGDLGAWRPDGCITYLGRNDDQVKIRGFRIELGDIEAQLATHATVKEVAVVARSSPQGERRLVAYFTKRPGADPAPETLRAHMQALLPAHMVPSAFVMLPRLPLTSSGKLDRRSLPEPQEQAYASDAHEPPEGDTERQLAEIWGSLLGVQRIGRSDNFFALGGHSLLGTKLVSRIEAHFTRRLPVVAIFRCPTIRQLAQLLEQQRAAPEHTTRDLPEYEEGAL